MNPKIKQMIVDLVLSNINKELPWQMPWRGQAQNYLYDTTYRGINQVLLSVIAAKHDWRNLWLTRKQAWSVGHQIKQGEKYSPLIKYLFVEDENNGGQKYLGAKFYQMYSIDQLTDPPEQVINNHEIREPENILARSPVHVPVNFGGNRAYYSPREDTIQLPRMQDFISSEHYYSTYFHELSHATGHVSRLNRFSNDSFVNRESYAQEELIAEFSAAFLCGECGIDNTHDQSAAYIAGWKKAIKKNPNAVVEAISAAQKATDLILGNQFNTDDEVLTVNQPAEVTA